MCTVKNTIVRFSLIREDLNKGLEEVRAFA